MRVIQNIKEEVKKVGTFGLLSYFQYLYLRFLFWRHKIGDRKIGQFDSEVNNLFHRFIELEKMASSDNYFTNTVASMRQYIYREEESKREDSTLLEKQAFKAISKRDLNAFKAFKKIYNSNILIL